MKLIKFMIPVLVLLFASCHNEDFRSGYQTACAYLSDNYLIGEKVVFENSAHKTDTFVVTNIANELRFSNYYKM